ncbi:MAG: ATP-dependent dethiobiotin synthetase BioD [Pseudomonadota bacterium]
MQTKKGFFILGTDTHVGKTTIAVNLLSFLKKHGYSTLGLKPIATGALQTEYGLRNPDAIYLQKTATIPIPYEQVNPFCFLEPVAPHIAAAQQSTQLSVDKVMALCELSLNLNVDYCIVEGLGGAAVPLNEKETMLDLAQKIDLPIILIVGLRLGCLNHALLSYEVLRKRGIPVAACICNQLDPTLLFYKENALYLKQAMMDVPFFSFMHYQNQKTLESDVCINWANLLTLENESLFDMT